MIDNPRNYRILFNSAEYPVLLDILAAKEREQIIQLKQETDSQKLIIYKSVLLFIDNLISEITMRAKETNQQNIEVNEE